ncbi:hypothetical protein LZC95_50080 [Pendulispora brunnea]|uniref:Uncharacterized protein n=1 Tax=Pendulispora brunnea TaxID=2905690 RepID=A0ABZ2KAF1_9BACT
MSDVPLFALRASTALESDLDWYFGAAESEMGLESNFGAFATAAMRGRTSAGATPDGLHDRQVEAAHRHRQIRARLRSMPATLVGVLAAAYEPRQWPRELVQAFGRTSGVAVRTFTARTAYKKACTKKMARQDSVSTWLLGVVLRGERELLTRIRVETDGLFGRACRAYEDVCMVERRLAKTA